MCAFFSLTMYPTILELTQTNIFDSSHNVRSPTCPEGGRKKEYFCKTRKKIESKNKQLNSQIEEVDLNGKLFENIYIYIHI